MSNHSKRTGGAVALTAVAAAMIVWWTGTRLLPSDDANGSIPETRAPAPPTTTEVPRRRRVYPRHLSSGRASPPPTDPAPVVDDTVIMDTVEPGMVKKIDTIMEWWIDEMGVEQASYHTAEAGWDPVREERAARKRLEEAFDHCGCERGPYTLDCDRFPCYARVLFGHDGGPSNSPLPALSCAVDCGSDQSISDFSGALGAHFTPTQVLWSRPVLDDSQADRIRADAKSKGLHMTDAATFDNGLRIRDYYGLDDPAGDR